MALKNEKHILIKQVKHDLAADDLQHQYYSLKICAVAWPKKQYSIVQHWDHDDEMTTIKMKLLVLKQQQPHMKKKFL